MKLFIYRIRNRFANYSKKIVSCIFPLFKKWFNRKEFFTLMIIPHAPIKNVRSVKFSKWIVSSFVILNVIMFSAVCIFCFSYFLLSANLQNKRLEYNVLESMKDNNEKQFDQYKANGEKQLNEYKANENGIMDKIQVLKGLEEKLKEIIESKGGKPQSYNKNTLNLASRGSNDVLRSVGNPSYSADNSEYIQDINIAVDELVKEVDGKINELNGAIVQAEKQIKIINAKPTLLPIQGTFTSIFGYRKNPFGRGYEFHTGLDIANSRGTPVKASGSGTVTHASYDSGYGNLVIINHGNGYESLYGHNSKLAVTVGQEVTKGQVISYVGSTGSSTGNHCHFEVRLSGRPINPLSVK